LDALISIISWGINLKLPICIAIPTVKTETAILIAQEAQSAGAQFVEFRIDYAPDVSTWNIEKYQALVRSVSIPVILTMRIKSEGGQQEINEVDRYDILRTCFEAHPAYVDVAVIISKQKLEEFYTLSQKFQVGIIYSYHNFKGTPNDIQAETIISIIRSKCPGLKENGNAQYLMKLVFLARTQRDNLVVLDICQQFMRRKQKVICFCMGDKGIHSRVMSIACGGLFSYASLHQNTAPGQISIQDFEKYFEENKSGYTFTPEELA